MTNEEMARGYITRAYRILGEAEGHYEQQAWNLVVRRCQEAVELALKGALRFVGLEVPQIHDVGAFLKRHRKRFRGKMAEEIDRLASISRRLREEREVSFYGDEEMGIPAEELYTQQDADEALSEARFVLELCQHFILRRNRPNLQHPKQTKPTKQTKMVDG